MRWAGGCSSWYDTCLQRWVLWRRCWCQSWDGKRSLHMRWLQDNLWEPAECLHSFDLTGDKPRRCLEPRQAGKSSAPTLDCTATSPWLPWFEGFLLIVTTSLQKHHMQIKWMVVPVVHFVVSLGFSWGNDWGGVWQGLHSWQIVSLWGNGFKLKIKKYSFESFLKVTGTLSLSQRRLPIKVQHKSTVWGPFCFPKLTGI